MHKVYGAVGMRENGNLARSKTCHGDRSLPAGKRTLNGFFPSTRVPNDAVLSSVSYIFLCLSLYLEIYDAFLEEKDKRTRCLIRRENFSWTDRSLGVAISSVKIHRLMRQRNRTVARASAFSLPLFALFFPLRLSAPFSSTNSLLASVL